MFYVYMFLKISRNTFGTMITVLALIQLFLQTEKIESRQEVSDPNTSFTHREEIPNRVMTPARI